MFMAREIYAKASPNIRADVDHALQSCNTVLVLYCGPGPVARRDVDCFLPVELLERLAISSAGSARFLRGETGETVAGDLARDESERARGRG